MQLSAHAYGVLVPSGHEYDRLSHVTGSGGGGWVAGGCTVHMVPQSSDAVGMSTHDPAHDAAHCSAVKHAGLMVLPVTQR